MAQYGININALLRQCAMRAGAARTGDDEGISYQESVEIARKLAEDAGLDSARWISTDTGEQYDLAPASALRRSVASVAGKLSAH